MDTFVAILHGYFQFSINWAGKAILDAFKWLFDLIQYLFNLFFQIFFEAAAHIVGIVPAPGFADDACSAYSQIPNSIIWILGYAQFGFGIATIFSAYGIRFAIRRIPVVG